MPNVLQIPVENALAKTRRDDLEKEKKRALSLSQKRDCTTQRADHRRSRYLMFSVAGLARKRNAQPYLSISWGEKRRLKHITVEREGGASYLLRIYTAQKNPSNFGKKKKKKKGRPRPRGPVPWNGRVSLKHPKKEEDDPCWKALKARGRVVAYLEGISFVIGREGRGSDLGEHPFKHRSGT